MRRRIKVTVYGMTKPPATLNIGSTLVENVRFDQQAGRLEFQIEDPAKGSEVHIAY